MISKEGIKFQIIVSDDESDDNFFDRIKDYFRNNEFNDYKLIEHKENEGTVCSFYDALMECKVDRVKLISPGDEIIGTDTIKNGLIALLFREDVGCFRV